MAGMDELRMLGTVLAVPDPSDDALDHSRDRLRETMHGPVRRLRIGWPAIGLGLTAAAAGTAAAVVIASGVTAPTASPGSPPAVTRLSGPQVLLAAATTAESRPLSSGKYWHVRHDFEDTNGLQTSDVWIRRDGQAWGDMPPNGVRKLRPGNGFSVGGQGITFSQIQRLPADPDQLKETLLRRLKHPVPSSALSSLTDVLWAVPARPKVRAAAFRALAELPHIENRGRTKGGNILLVLTIDDAGSKLVIDPRTSRLVSAEGFTNFGGHEESMGVNTFTVGWTNRLP